MNDPLDDFDFIDDDYGFDTSYTDDYDEEAHADAWRDIQQEFDFGEEEEE